MPAYIIVYKKMFDSVKEAQTVNRGNGYYIPETYLYLNLEST